MLKPDLNRREFVKLTAGAGAALAMPTIAFPGESKKMIGIQVGAISFVDEGTEKVLDILQQRGERQHAISRGLYLWTRHRRAANSRSTAAGSRQAGIRPQFSRRKFCDAASGVLQEHSAEGNARAGSRQPRHPRGSDSGGEKTQHEGDLLAGGCVPRKISRISRKCRNAICTGEMRRRFASTIRSTEIF